MLSVRPGWLWGDIAYFQREGECERGMLESWKALITSPGTPGALAKTLQDFAALYPNGKEKKKEKRKATHINKLQAQYETPKPIILSLRKMKHEVSPQGMTAEADTHSLPATCIT